MLEDINNSDMIFLDGLRQLKEGTLLRKLLYIKLLF